MAGLRNQSFDDRETTSLIYGGIWFKQGAWNASHTGETGTLTSSSDLNANVTFIFPVPAVAFYYYGIPRSNGGTYGICIDCDPNGRIFDTIDAVNRSDDGKNPPVVLYSRKFQTPGVHEIILRNQPDTRFANNNSQITIDRFEIEVVDPNTTPPTSSAAADPIPTTTVTPGQELRGAKTISVGAIIGAIIAILAVFLFVGWWCLLKRRRRIHDEVGNASEILPHIPLPSAQRIPPSEGRGGKQPHATSSSLGSRSAWMSSMGPPAAVTTASTTRVPKRETDAGPVAGDDDLETLPPEYEQVIGHGRRSIGNAAGNAGRLPPVHSAGKR